MRAASGYQTKTDLLLSRRPARPLRNNRVESASRPTNDCPAASLLDRGLSLSVDRKSDGSDDDAPLDDALGVLLDARYVHAVRENRDYEHAEHRPVRAPNAACECCSAHAKHYGAAASAIPITFSGSSTRVSRCFRDRLVPRCA